jgi:tetratricopeptide (TPR) repeat protein
MLERIVSLYPENTEVISDLAWMYFKTYQLTKGEKLLKESIEAFGENRNFSMTLGTIYSGMYEYDSARRYYLDSIKQSPGEEGKYFSSVAYYNLSLLEHGFYHYNSALEYTDASLNLADRAPGHLARGELWKARMDFEKAHEEYQKAYSIDATPLAKINLADLYVKWGRFDSSKAYLDEVMNTTNNSWMYYFGTDMKRHYMEIHRVYEKLYEGMANRERVMPRKGIVKKIRSLFSLLSYRILSWYHGRKYRSYSYDVGTFYQNEGNLLDADWAFYQANEQYPEVARTYLERARQFETSIAPASAPFYLLEEGKVRKDPQILHEAIDAFHPVWEREGTADALAALIPLLRREGHKIEARDALNRLYEISHSALLVNGLGLPIEIRGEVDSGLRRGLKRCGFELSLAEGEEGFLYALSLRGEGGRISSNSPIREQGLYWPGLSGALTSLRC